MLRYIGNRLLASIPTVLLVTVLVFLMLHLIPGDPAEIFLGENFSSPELLAQVRADMGLDRPLHVQYFSYLGNALQGDFGRSLNNNRPVLDEIALRLPPTVQLTLAAMAVGVLLGVSLGIISALGHNTWVDTAAMALALLGVSMPIFWMSLLLIFLFSVRLNWLPALSTEGWRGLVLPALALGLLSSSTLARMVRSSMLEVLSQDYVRTARSKGLRERTVVLRHALKNALIPTLTVLGLQFGQLLGGAVITETIFARQGIGRLYVESILRKDFTMVQGLTLLIAVAYVLINLAVDVAYAAVDPRIQYE
jgi:ABC-type dipeptide/oligopeptide/nickel transport system permease component